VNTEVAAEKLAGDCKPGKGEFPEQCVVRPRIGGKGFDWVDQLRESQCSGNLFLIELGEGSGKYVGVKAIGTEDVVNGYFVHTYYVVDTEDEEWVKFSSTSIELKAEEQGVVVSIQNNYYGNNCPLNLMVYGKDGNYVFDRSEYLKIIDSRADSKVHIVQQKSPTIEIEQFGYIFWPKRTETTWPKFEEDMQAFGDDSLKLCTPPTEK